MRVRILQLSLYTHTHAHHPNTIMRPTQETATFGSIPVDEHKHAHFMAMSRARVQTRM